MAVGEVPGRHPSQGHPLFTSLDTPRGRPCGWGLSGQKQHPPGRGHEIIPTPRVGEDQEAEVAGGGAVTPRPCPASESTSPCPCWAPRPQAHISHLGSGVRSYCVAASRVLLLFSCLLISCYVWGTARVIPAPQKVQQAPFTLTC